jgi:hypothetical protein
MFFRAKTVAGHLYLHLVANERREGKTVQKLIASLGRLDELEAKGSIDSLIDSLRRIKERPREVRDKK